MFVTFWSALQMHRWHHAPDPLKQQALLLYQAQQCRRWHLHAGATNSWSLETINDLLLVEVREDLFNEQYTQQMASAIQQAAAAYIANNLDTLRPHQPVVQKHQQHMNPGQQPSASLKQAQPPYEEEPGGGKKYALGVTRTIPLTVMPLKHGTGNTRLSQSGSTKYSGPRTTNFKSAQHGRERKDVASSSTMPTTSAQAAAPSVMEPSSALVHRRSHPLTPYKADAWERELCHAGVLERFAKIPGGLHLGFKIDFPSIHTVQTPLNRDSINEFPVEFNNIVQNELEKGRFIRPFTTKDLKELIGPFQSSPLSIIPKPGKPGKFRIIQNFSFLHYPSHSFPNPSIKSHINAEKFPTTWGKFSIVYRLISQLPLGSEAATCDVAEAYRMVLLPHPNGQQQSYESPIHFSA
ncbi:hypothetical protein AZE42_05675 [Rhizopogon vesiculosus]|uniref:Uncharacterized protein n=1 Tax=Rhizopogon vesiculosus TaxID=180088 RepID=A0A1J8R1D7_9AGAM|nr:hypothetical protein AZE42_05675 [Rhizopogon vesiculosus]